ncbi:MAG: response regulator transcription factor [Eubacterium sp.]|nr:response regulator transcription factor [Eubacterium sp.]
MFNILVVEDDREWLKSACIALRRRGFNAISAGSSSHALDRMDDMFIDMCVAGISGSDAETYSFIESLKRSNYQYLPIIIVSDSNSYADMEKAFNAGADDYLVVPVNFDELALRIKALMRRASITNEKKIKIGSTALDLDALTLTQNGNETLLPQKEFLLLYKLLSSPNKIFNRQQIMDEIWGFDSESDEKTINVHINRLRDRLRDNEDIEIQTVRGLGYKAIVKEKAR